MVCLAWAAALLLAAAAQLVGTGASFAPPPPAPTLVISEPAPLLSHEQMVEWKVDWPDAALYSTLSKDGRKFFMEGGPAGDDPGTPWVLTFSKTFAFILSSLSSPRLGWVSVRFRR